MFSVCAWLSGPAICPAAVTASYLFLDDVIHQPALPPGFPTNWGATRVDYGMDPDVVNDPAYASTLKDDLKTIPSVSVVLSNDDFFSAAKGIYANTQAHGVEWEKPASGEKIELQDAAGRVIHSFRFDDRWFPTTDGGGFSLTVRDLAATDPNRLDDKSIWRPSTQTGGTAGSGDRP